MSPADGDAHAEAHQPFCPAPADAASALCRRFHYPLLQPWLPYAAAAAGVDEPVFHHPRPILHDAQLTLTPAQPRFSAESAIPPAFTTVCSPLFTAQCRLIQVVHITGSR